MDHCSKMLVERFESFSRSGAEQGKGEGQMIQLQNWLQYFAFDVIGEITFGRPFGLLKEGRDNGAIEAIGKRLLYSSLVGVYPWLHGWLYPLIPKAGGHAFVMGFTLESIARRKEELKSASEKEGGVEVEDEDGEMGEQKRDLLSQFLEVKREGVEEGTKDMTDLDIVLMCHTNIAAGFDTTAITLSAIFYNLLRHPVTLDKLRNEIDQAYEDGRLSDPMTFKETQGLTYLQAVIKEGLRIFPATGLPMQRVVPKEGASLAGRWFKGGEMVGINSWVAHANQDVFGKDAEEWRPDRWLEYEEQGRGAEVEKYFLSFGMGSRMCLGKNISLLEMSKVVPLLFRKFDFELEEGLRGGREWRTRNRWFVKQLDFGVRVRLRQVR